MAIMSVAMDEITDISSRLGIDPSTIDLDSIVLPPDDNMGIPSDDEHEPEEDFMEFDNGFGCIIVVDNIPEVPKEKFEKLENVIRKIYSQIGQIKDSGLWMSVDDSGRTLGYCFIEFNTPQEALLAKEKTTGNKLDRSHIFVVNMFEDFEKFMGVPDEWAPPDKKEYIHGENLQHWLTDGKARDQFVIRAGSDTEVLWNDARHLKPDPVYKRAYWTESYGQWSPLGTYLVTLHRQGAAVWGGAPSFNRNNLLPRERIERLIDPGTSFLELSQLAGQERYEGIPQIALVLGSCTAGGAYIPAMADEMCEGDVRWSYAYQRRDGFSICVALVFAKDRHKSRDIGETHFHATISDGLRPIGNIYKAASVRTPGVAKSSTWLTAKRDGSSEVLNGYSMVHDIDDETRNNNVCRDLFTGILKHGVSGFNEEHFFLDGLGIRTGDSFQFYTSDPITAQSSCSNVSEELRRLKNNWTCRHCCPTRSNLSIAKTEVCCGFVFACCGRGERFFEKLNVDSSPLLDIFPEIPVAGMFCDGEIGCGCNGFKVSGVRGTPRWPIGFVADFKPKDLVSVLYQPGIQPRGRGCFGGESIDKAAPDGQPAREGSRQHQKSPEESTAATNSITAKV